MKTAAIITTAVTLTVLAFIGAISAIVLAPLLAVQFWATILGAN